MKFFFLVLTLLIQIAWSHEVRFFDSGDVKIAYREIGSGIPLVILNGGPGRSSQTFIPLAEEFSKLGYKVYIFDQRGTGQSKVEWTEQKINLDLMVEDLEKLRQHLKLEKLSLMGHSFGGIYAMAYAKKYPKQLKHLILSASGGMDMEFRKFLTTNLLSKVSPERRKLIRELWKREKALEDSGKDYLAISNEISKQFAPAYVFNQKFVPQLEKDLPDPNVNNPGVARLVWKDMEKLDLKGSFKDFTVPTLILSGRQDFLGEGVPLTIQANIPNSELIFFNECSHYPWMDVPKEYFAAIQKHLK